jgi:DNA-binding NtrC family response regulator
MEVSKKASSERKKMGKGKKVLVVDDDKLVHDTISFAFQGDSAVMLHAMNLDEANHFWQRERGDIGCVLLDWDLNDETSKGLLGRIHEEDPEMEVIIFSGHQREEVISEAVKYGAKDFIRKGEEISLLRKKVLKALKKSEKRNLAPCHGGSQDRGCTVAFNKKV